MIQFATDAELFAWMRKTLYSAVLGDIMDKMGHTHQFLPPAIQPLQSDMVVAGRAMTVLEADVCGECDTGANELLKKPFGLMLEALDDLKPDEVYICTGSSPTYALWGELMSTRAQILGSAGAVVNGYSRDTRGILKLAYPTFSIGRYAQDQGPRGKVIDYRVPIEVEGVHINPGDIVFGDIDGVVIVPQRIECEVLALAYEKVLGEQVVSKAIAAGMSAKDSFDKHGIM